MDVHSLSPQNDFTATRYIEREVTAALQSNISSTDRGRNQTQLGRLHTAEPTECITLRDPSSGITIREQIKASLNLQRRRSDDSNGTVARGDVSGDAESDVETDTDIDLGGDRVALAHGLVYRRGSFDRRLLQAISSSSSLSRLSDAGSIAGSGLENLPRRRRSITPALAHAPLPTVHAGDAQGASKRSPGREGAQVSAPVSRSRKRSATATAEGNSNTGAASGMHHKRARIAQNTAGTAGTAVTKGTHASAPVSAAHHAPARDTVIAAPAAVACTHDRSSSSSGGAAAAAASLITPAANAAVGDVVAPSGADTQIAHAESRESSAAAPPPPLPSSGAAAAPAGFAVADVNLPACTLPAVGKLRCGSDAGAARAPNASDSPADLAGCAFVPAGKVSNGHVVGRVPIGFTPFYPTIDLRTGKHAVMQVFNGPLKTDFLRYELPMLNSVEAGHGMGPSGVLRVLDVVDHGDAVLVFREPFVSDLHTQLRKSGRFEEELARDYFAQMAGAVAEMHANDIVLGASLRLNSVVLASKDMVTLKLASLEAAHSTDGFGRTEFEPLSTATCLAYAPPEQVGRLQASADVGSGDKSCDIWALGVMLFSMLNGSFPFVSMKTDPDAARDEICEKIMAGKWLLPNQPRFTLAAHALLRMLLHPCPEQRPSAEAILSHPWVSASTVLSSNAVPRAYDACPAAAYASSASDSLLTTMQARSVAPDDQCVPC